MHLGVEILSRLDLLEEVGDPFAALRGVLEVACGTALSALGDGSLLPPLVAVLPTAVRTAGRRLVYKPAALQEQVPDGGGQGY